MILVGHLVAEHPAHNANWLDDAHFNELIDEDYEHLNARAIRKVCLLIVEAPASATRSLTCLCLIQQSVTERRIAI